MLFPLVSSPDDLAEFERAAERWHPDRETLLLAAAGAATVLGPDHSATKAFANLGEPGCRATSRKQPPRRSPSPMLTRPW